MAERPTKEELAAALAVQPTDGKLDTTVVDVLKAEVAAIRNVAIDIADQTRTITCPECKTQYEVAVPLVHLTQVVEAPKTDASPVGVFR